MRLVAVIILSLFSSLYLPCQAEESGIPLTEHRYLTQAAIYSNFSLDLAKSKSANIETSARKSLYWFPQSKHYLLISEYEGKSGYGKVTVNVTLNAQFKVLSYSVFGGGTDLSQANLIDGFKKNKSGFEQDVLQSAELLEKRDQDAKHQQALNQSILNSEEQYRQHRPPQVFNSRFGR